jgi:hypothetical protein
MRATNVTHPTRGWVPAFLFLAITWLLSGCANPAREWGRDELARIERQFALHGSARDGLYRERLNSDQIAFAWPLGVQLSALSAAASVDRAYERRLHEVIDAAGQYWRIDAHGLGGYDASCRNTGPLDRYYDDNGWLVLALVEAKDLRRAQRTLRFVLSGEDATLGGGIWWHERSRQSKNTCSNAPAIVACLAVDALAGNHEHLATARRLHDWTDAHLRETDGDGLYFDHLALDGKLDRTAWSYNTALMIRAKCMLFDVTRERRYLDDARRLALAAERRWVKPDTGAIADDSQFAHLLAEAFLELADRDVDARRWRAVVERAITFAHNRNIDANGLHPKKWDAIPAVPLENAELIWQASAARAYFRFARDSAGARIAHKRYR